MMLTPSFSSDGSESPESRSETLQNLRADLRRLQGATRLSSSEKPSVSTGIEALDEILPDRGLLRGTLSEWIGAEYGSGALSLVMQTAVLAQREGPVVFIDPGRSLYAPAVEAAGVLLEELILVRPPSRKEALWAVEQSLRCPGVGAVVYCVDRLRTQEFRRLQLAAEAGTAVGLLLRPPEARRQLGWADVRLLVTPVPASPPSRQETSAVSFPQRVPAASPPQGTPAASRQEAQKTSRRRASPPRGQNPLSRFRRRVEVRCLYAKGSLADQTVELELCDETGAVCLAAGLSDSASESSEWRAAGA